MGHLGFGRPGDQLLQRRPLLGGEGLQVALGDLSLREALVHEADVALDDHSHGLSPIRGHIQPGKLVESLLVGGAVSGHGCSPVRFGVVPIGVSMGENRH